MPQTATVERIVFRNEDNGYTIIAAKIGYSPIIVTCCIPYLLKEGEEFEFEGKPVDHARYGRQIKAAYVQPKDPTTEDGIRAYLSSGVIRGIGPVTAERIVQLFGENTLTLLDESPQRLLEVKGIGNKTLAKIAASWKEKREGARIVAELCKIPLSYAYASRVYKQYGAASLGVLKENPYRLADEVTGIGFKTADDIARALGFDKDHPFRIMSGILHSLTEAQIEGHCFLPHRELLNRSCAILDLPEDAITEKLQPLISETRLIHNRLHTPNSTELEDAYYHPSAYHAERYVEKKLRQLAGLPDRNIPMTLDLSLTTEQALAAEIAISKGLSIITGAAGTGKSYTLTTITRTIENLGFKYYLCAPTGKASKRITEVTGREAKTIHRLIGYDPHIGARRDEQHPLDPGYVLVDEASMIDIYLMRDLLRAIPPTGRLILIGDPNQLPPVGVGTCFKSLISSGLCPVVRLKKIKRQKEESSVIRIATEINQGLSPSFPDSSDAFFFRIEEPAKVAETIVQLATSKVPHKFGIAIKDIQVITPMRKGPIGTEVLNKMLQAALQPADAPSLRGYKVNDRVMQTQNNYQRGSGGVFNGDMGYIVHLDLEEQSLYVQYDGYAEPIEYAAGDLEEITHSFACSCHRFQGAQSRCIIFPLHTTQFKMLRRDLLYTAVTRAQELLIVVGTSKAMAIAVKNDADQKRYTSLLLPGSPGSY